MGSQPLNDVHIYLIIPLNFTFSKSTNSDTMYTTIMKKKSIINALIVLAGLIVVALILGIQLGLSQSFRLVFGSVFMLFLPGFIVTWILWGKKTISPIERFVLSLVFSIAIVPLVVFLLNKTGVLITSANIIIIVAAILLIGGVILFYKYKFKKAF